MTGGQITKINQVFRFGGVNNFDILRFIAALLVIISHSYAISGNPPEPQFLGANLGVIGVYIFFVISGFLVTNSWKVHPRASAFLAKRCLRILPGLAGVTLFTALILGPLVTTQSLREYFTSSEVFSYLGNVWVFSIKFDLPGVFTNNPIPGITNGSLWTLPYEFLAYISLTMLGVFGLLGNKRRLLVIVVATVATLFALAQVYPVGKPHLLNMEMIWIAKYLSFFAAGMFLNLLSHRIGLSYRYALAALVVMLLSPYLPGGFVLLLGSFSYLVIYLALMPTKHLHRFGEHGDFSYGMYLYAWPIQQLLVYKFTDIGPIALILGATPIVIALGWASWRLIEKPSLAHKKRFGTTRYPYTAQSTT